MPTTITATEAVEESTCVIKCVFTDEDGNAVIPATLTWTLTDISGNIINSRENVSVAVPASTTYITLTGDDLALTAGRDQDRILLVEGTYDSAYGTGLNIKDSARFTVKNLVAEE